MFFNLCIYFIYTYLHTHIRSKMHSVHLYIVLQFFFCTCIIYVLFFKCHQMLFMSSEMLHCSCFSSDAVLYVHCTLSSDATRYHQISPSIHAHTIVYMYRDCKTERLIKIERLITIDVLYRLMKIGRQRDCSVQYLTIRWHPIPSHINRYHQLQPDTTRYHQVYMHIQLYTCIEIARQRD
jgi:hypothetical protein